jgi:sulfur-carrier protein adenylyltransferase/sulfurtransferase
MPLNLTPEQYLRYSRHLILPEVGLDGQKKLLSARVLMIGAGGLGSPLGLYLAAAGVGTLGIVDPDVVDESNLQRQILHSTEELGKPKVDSAARRLRALNPDVQIRTYQTKLSSDNALEIFDGYDIVVDGTDNFATRYLVNDACVLTGKTNVYGSIFRFEGQATVFKPGAGPCYRCLYPEPPPPGMVPSCAEGGVLGILPGIVGNIQALETIKQILGAGESLVGRLVLFNALSFRFRELKIRRDPGCPVCGDRPTVTALIDYNEFCGVPADEKKRAFEPELEIHAAELHRRLLNDEELLLLDVREPTEWQICHIKGAELIPVGELPMRWQEIAEHKDRPIVTYCHKGVRSLRALRHLQGAGFTNVKSLHGGVDAWASDIDPDMARY